MLFKPWLEEHYFYMTGLASFPTYSIGFFYCSPTLKPSNMASIQMPPLMARQDFLDSQNLPPKLLALNNWPLDGDLGSNSKPDYRAYKKDQVRIVYSRVFIDSKITDTVPLR